MFTLETVSWLESDAGSTVLERLTGENLSDDNALRLLTSLRRDLSPERAGAALELARLRARAVTKFGADASQMFFTREALEQASDPLIRQWRSRFFKAQAGESLLDVCSGIGSDGIALASAGWQVTGYDLDPVRVLMANLNAQAVDCRARFEVADVREIALTAGAIFFDPARRDNGGKRIFHVESYLPPLSLVQSFSAPRWEVKLSPGVEIEQIAPYFDGRTRLTFVSVSGDLKEACLERDFATTGEDRRAVLLTGADVLEMVSSEGQAPIGEPRQWLIEPDPALIRAGLVGDAALKFNGMQLDESIAYFTTDKKPESAWVRSWRILDWMPFNGKKLREYLRERGVGKVTVKKRGTAVTPEVLIPQLKLKGSQARTLVLTRLAGKQIVMICEELSP